MQSVAKTAIVRALREKSNSFRCKFYVTEIVLSRDDLIAAIEQDTEVGREFVNLAQRFDIDLEAVAANNASNTMGKRYKCDECGMQLLITKAGEGRTSCCGKMTTVQIPKPLPSAE